MLEVLDLLSVASSLTDGHQLSFVARTDIILILYEMKDFEAIHQVHDGDLIMNGLVAGYCLEPN